MVALTGGGDVRWKGKLVDVKAWKWNWQNLEDGRMRGEGEGGVWEDSQVSDLLSWMEGSVLTRQGSTRRGYSLQGRLGICFLSVSAWDMKNVEGGYVCQAGRTGLRGDAMSNLHGCRCLDWDWMVKRVLPESQEKRSIPVKGNRIYKWHENGDILGAEFQRLITIKTEEAVEHCTGRKEKQEVVDSDYIWGGAQESRGWERCTLVHIGWICFLQCAFSVILLF